MLVMPFVADVDARIVQDCGIFQPFALLIGYPWMLRVRSNSASASFAM